jgi:hypothetical protein
MNTVLRAGVTTMFMDSGFRRNDGQVGRKAIQSSVIML